MADLGGNLSISVQFEFTQQQLDSLRCHNPAALEVDVVVSGAVQNYGDRTNRTNLPNSYVDTEFDDDYSTRVLTVGTTAPENLRADSIYYLILDLDGYVRAIDSEMTVGLDFQRGRWAGLSPAHPVEAAACARGARRDPAWCVFAANTQVMSKNGMDPIHLPNASNYVESGAWGGPLSN
ncbi:hypothetical protein [Actinomycetospora chlora]|uniref:hypothetical protein n=1 Tax=Actinomycetospora chlora TaxID=663608 RepID=UPI0031E7BF89